MTLQGKILEWHRKNPPLPWPDGNTVSDVPQDTAGLLATLKPMFNLPSITTARSLSAGLLSVVLFPSVCVHPELPHSRCGIQHLTFIWLVTAQPSVYASLPSRDTTAPDNLVLSMSYVFCPQLVPTKISAAWSSKKQTHMDSKSKADKLIQPRIQLSCVLRCFSDTPGNGCTLISCIRVRIMASEGCS